MKPILTEKRHFEIDNEANLKLKQDTVELRMKSTLTEKRHYEIENEANLNRKKILWN